MRLPGQSDKPGNPDSQIIPEMALFASIIAHNIKEKPLFLGVSVIYFYYLFITYIVTSKPNLISVADGFVQAFIVVLLLCCIFN